MWDPVQNENVRPFVLKLRYQDALNQSWGPFELGVTYLGRRPWLTIPDTLKSESLMLQNSLVIKNTDGRASLHHFAIDIFMSLSKLSNYSEPNFPSLNEDNYNTYEIGLLRELNQFKIYSVKKR